jgi:hypothetical protein
MLWITALEVSPTLSTGKLPSIPFCSTTRTQNSCRYIKAPECSPMCGGEIGTGGFPPLPTAKLPSNPYWSTTRTQNSCSYTKASECSAMCGGVQGTRNFSYPVPFAMHKPDKTLVAILRPRKEVSCTIGVTVFYVSPSPPAPSGVH